jgi:hypothetical protein
LNLVFTQNSTLCLPTVSAIKIQGISLLMNDYLDQKNNLHSLYNRFPTIENFEGQILEKQANYDDSNRVALVSVLQKQYALLKLLI